jgi:adenylate kinase family enzyme
MLVFECPEEILVQRLLQRGRGDDDTETIEKRIATFQSSTEAVIDRYDERAKVVRLRADTSREIVYERILAALENAGIGLRRR